MVVKNRWLIFGIGALALAGLAALAGWWLPPLLDFVGANSDLIQGMTDLVQLLLWVGAGAVVVIGWLVGRRAGREPAPSASTTTSTVEASGSAVLATDDSVAAGQIAVRGNVEGDIIYVANPDQLWDVISRKRPTVDLAEATKRYLAYLVDRYRYLDFRGMGVTDRAPLRLALTELYVPLKARIELPEGETWARTLPLAGRQMSEEEIAATGQRLSEPLPVIELLQQQSGLIVLGDPGAGKTTFLKYLALHMAQGRHGELGMEQRIPFLLPLSAYANRLAAGDNVPLDEYIYEYYRGLDGALAVGPILDEALERGGALLLLDGLDEVKEIGRRRTVVEQVTHFFSSRRAPGNKFVLTSRIVGYRDVRPVVEGLAECTLVDFEQEEIEAFVGKWTAAIEQSARGNTPVAAQQAEQERSELLQAVARNPGVRRLASNPLLLTILALMKRQGVTLPERRVELYRNYVDTLLKHWNLARSLGRPPTRDLDVVETLRVLAPLALWMHEVSPGVGLVKQEEMRRKLEALYAQRGVDDPEKAAAHFLGDVRDHAGLLVERGAREYGFIHLTFQEYLAAVAIAQQGQLDVEPVVDALAAHVADDNWHEVSLLTISYLGIIQQRDQFASMVVDQLIERAPGEPGVAVVLAGGCVLDAWPGGVTSACKRTTIEQLLATMRSGPETTPVTRAAAGRLLGKLGDPRIEVLDPFRIEWCDVPAGPFLMGSDDDSPANDPEKPQHQVVVSYDYRISRYPITNAQFECFVTDGGYSCAQYWREAEVDWVWADGKVKAWLDGRRYSRPPDTIEPFCLSNHPVVGITWYEALAFTRWLTDALEGLGQLQNGWSVQLPSEAEWEKAARGIDVRIFPWGEAITPQYANYVQTGIGTSNAVGSFLSGCGPFRCEEMSGNVWEWTRSLAGSVRNKFEYGYPYNSADGREQIDAISFTYRVMRGGSYNDEGTALRCAVREAHLPDYRLRNAGFRVVLIPFSLDGCDSVNSSSDFN